MPPERSYGIVRTPNFVMWRQVWDDRRMGSSATTEYCAFTKAVEHLGDRWSLLIVRELAEFGPRGFNSLATGLPVGSPGRC
jgi:DNA-binding HxlR family transcriptional regulator